MTKAQGQRNAILFSQSFRSSGRDILPHRC